MCGFGRIGQVVAERLSAAGDAFVIVDKDPDSVELARRRGYLAVAGDATDGALLANLGLGRQATRILCLTHDDVSNVYITLTARQVVAGHPHHLARQQGRNRAQADPGRRHPRGAAL